MENNIKHLLRMKNYYFEITSPDGRKVIKKKYKGKYEGEAYDKLNSWLSKHEEYQDWSVKFKGESYL